MDFDATCDNKVAVFTIQRPPHNFFSPDLLQAIADEADQLCADGDTCRAIVLRSEGKNFCAGADFSDGGVGTSRAARARRTYGQAVRLFSIPVPVIACVQGAAVGGGLGLACAADFRLSTETSRFHANFTQLGFHPGFALTARLEELVGKQWAKHMLLRSLPVRGQQAVDIGLSDELVAPDALWDRGLELAHELAALAPLAVRSVKATLGNDLHTVTSRTLEHELHEQSWLWETEDAAAGVAANLKRETAVFVGR